MQPLARAEASARAEKQSNASCLQLHQSKVAALSFSPDGASLWSGCDAAAPRPLPGGSGSSSGLGGEPPVVQVSCKVSHQRD
jgi:hypothetical protein